MAFSLSGAVPAEGVGGIDWRSPGYVCFLKVSSGAPDWQRLGLLATPRDLSQLLVPTDGPQQAGALIFPPQWRGQLL